MNTLKTAIASALLTASLTSATAADQLVYNWGPADTVAHHMVGPGMEYVKIVFPDKPLILWWVEVDLSNEYSKIEQVQSRHAVPDPLRWDVMTHYRENSRPGHRVKVAWNHDFFSYDAGVCIALNISEGEMTWHKWGRSVLAITEDKRAEVFRAEFDAHITTPDGTQVTIDYFNALNGGIYGDCVLYNRFNSKTLTEEGKYISLRPLDAWIVNGGDIRCQVMEVSDQPLQTAEGRYVLYLRGSKATALDGHAAVGDIINVTQSFASPYWGISPERILNAFHGYPSIVHDGVLHDGEYNNFENGREYEKSSRVMAGISRDKRKLYIATTEMSTASLGVDCIELAAFMVENGAHDVVNFDSGGSAAIVIDETMLNVPGRGAVRPVQDAMLAVSTAPDDETAHHITFSRPCISPSIISRTPLRILAYNQYDVPVCDDLKDCTFRCDPPELGTVDSEGIFHASDVAMGGHVIAEKDGMTAKIVVCTQPIDRIYPVRQSIFVDNQRHIPLEIEGMSDGLTRDIDPGAFAWTSDPAGIVEIDDNGILRGVANGKTTITGHLGATNISMGVTVEIADQNITMPIFNDLDAIKMQKPSSMKNTAIDYTSLPAGWDAGAIIDFDLASSRSANLSFNPELAVYSLPESMSMRMYDKTGASNKITMQFTDATGGRLTFSADPVIGDNNYTFDFKDTDGQTLPYYLFPLQLKRITIGLATSSMNDATLGFESLKFFYPGIDGVGTLSADATNGIDVTVQGETLVATLPSTGGAQAQIAVYDVTGRLILTKHLALADGSNHVSVDIKSLPIGLYAAMITVDGKPLCRSKFVVR